MKAKRWTFAALVVSMLASLLVGGIAFAAPLTEAGEGLVGDAALEEKAAEEAPLTGGDDSEAATSEDLDSTMSSEPAIPSGTYLIRGSGSNVHVLDVADGVSANGGNVQLYQSNMTAAQKYTIEAVERDDQTYYRILVTVGGVQKALDVTDGICTNGSNVQTYDPNGTDAQLWIAEEMDDGSYVFHSALDARFVLDVSGGVFANGANVQVWEANGSQAQRFFLIDLNPVVSTDAIEPGYYRVVSSLAGAKAMDVRDGSRENGAALQLYSQNGTLAQCFKIEELDSGYYAIRAVNSGKTLDVEAGNVVATTKVQTWDYDVAFKEWAIRTNDDGTVTFLAASSGLALDVAGGSATDWTALQLWYDNGTKAQKWTLEPAVPEVAEGVVTITVPMLSSTKVLDIAGASFDAGANVNIWSRNDGVQQKFLVEKIGNGAYRLQALCSGLYLSVDGSNVVQSLLTGAAQEWAVDFAWGGYTLRNVATGLVLDVAGGGDYDGCNVGVYEANGTAAQTFAFEYVPAVSPGIYTIHSACGNLALDVAGGSRANGANVQLWEANGTGAQIWRVSDAGDGWVTITNAKSGKALDVADAASVAGTNVQQWGAWDTAAQKWRFVPTGDGWFSIESACGGLVLDVAGGSAANGANAQVYHANGTNAQKFRLFQSADYSMSGNAELDWRIAEFVSSCTSDWMSDDTKLQACFNRVASFPYRSMAHEPWGSTSWSQWRALDMLSYGSGNCYNYAALFLWCARYLGYDAEVVSGGVPSLSQGWADHGWVEVYLEGATYVCDPDLQHEYPSLNWYMRTYGNAPTTYRK